MTNNLFVELVASGVPSQSNFANSIRSSVIAGGDFDGMIDQMIGLTGLFQSAALGSITWIASTTVEHGFPVLFIDQGLGESNNTATLSLYPETRVLDGLQAPTPFTGSDQNAYNEVAKIELVASIAGAPAFLCCMKVGVDAGVPIADFKTFGWLLVWPEVLRAVANAVDDAFGLAAGFQGAQSKDSATPARSSMNLGVKSLVGPAIGLCLKALKVIKGTIEIMKHSTGLQFLIFNFSAQALSISSSYYSNSADAQVVNTDGEVHEALAPCTVDAPVVVTLCDLRSVKLIQMTTLNIISNTSLHGLGVSAVVAQDGQTAAFLINAPYGSDNAIYVQSAYQQDATQFWDDNNSHQSTLPASLALSSEQSLTLQIDYLDGKHPDGDGKSAYAYHAALVIN